eukprot:TRINITY_DN28185_c0_g1_i1.p1 TRINITY_DN28185_c0_g1~~TRINITY_DN28185_c0_g1_i1.p1  ORF type:complete len:349 (+),score=110.10 TRINITY_DN28185_c0_g1_i1:45-1091(+)
MADDTPLARLRALVGAADALLVLAGAGMGADSGIGTFRGKAAGAWPGRGRWGELPPAPDGSTGLSQLNDARWFDERPAMAWEFWRWCYESYDGAAPHAGYAQVAAAAQEKPTFVVTTNIDGHFVKAGVPAAAVRELHGAATRVKCSGKGRDKGRVKALGDGEEDLRPLDFCEPDDFDDDEFVDDEPCSYAAALADHPEAGPFLERVLPATAEAAAEDPAGVLRCECGAVVRVDVLLFGDRAWPSNPPPGRLRDELARYDAFMARHLPPAAPDAAAPPRPRLAVLEIGAGRQFPTLRKLARGLVEAHPGVVHARINVEDADVSEIAPHHGSESVAVPCTALEALAHILP